MPNIAVEKAEGFLVCKTCVAYAPPAGPGVHGTCHARPPIPVFHAASQSVQNPVDAVIASEFPTVKPDDWCLEWKRDGQ